VSDLVATLHFRAGIGGEPIVTSTQGTAGYSFEVASWGARLRRPGVEAPGARAVSVDVGVGTCAEIRSAGESRAAPGWSSTSFSVVVESDAMLTWRLAPGAAAGGCDHLAEGTVQLAASARLLWVDEIAFDQEDPGTWRSRLRVTRDGWPVACRDLALGPGSALWESPAVLSGASALSVVTVVDPARPASRWQAQRAGVDGAAGVATPLSVPGAQIVAWGQDLPACRGVVEDLFAAGMPGWAEARWRVAGGLSARFEPAPL
jgi:hypothetical protein